MARNKSAANETMLEVPEDSKSAISGSAPGTATAPAKGVYFENLGHLADFPTGGSTSNPGEGSGESCVVLVDFMSGATPDDQFTKGQVVRLSRLIPGFTDETVDRDVIKSRIRRHFDNKSIRLATRDEQGQDFVEVTFETESDAMQSERDRRIAVERENEILRERLGIANEAMIAATPGQAGASGVAQNAVDGENAGTGDGEAEGDTFDD